MEPYNDYYLPLDGSKINATWGATVGGSKGLVINYGEGGGLQTGKIAPPPQDRVKPFAPPF